LARKGENISSVIFDFEPFLGLVHLEPLTQGGRRGRTPLAHDFGVFKGRGHAVNPASNPTQVSFLTGWGRCPPKSETCFVFELRESPLHFAVALLTILDVIRP
jgi:hypothetical protein